LRIIKRRQIEQWAGDYPDAAKPLFVWYEAARKAEWRNLQEVRRTFPHADGVRVKSRRIVTVFNIRKNRYRLLTAIHYDRQRVYTMRFLTHAQYDVANWKDEL